MIAVIMQPTYLPWIGYFDLMDTADIFVILDTVQFEKQAWQQRNRIKTAENQSKWLTVPVIQDFGQKMNAVKIGNTVPWCRKHWGTIGQYYKRAAYWELYSAGLARVYAQSWDYLLALNLTTINFLKEQFEIKTKIIRASEIPASGEKVSVLTNICHYLNSDIYLSPVRAAEYIEQDNIFAQEGITLLYHRYEHPVYTQMYGGFISHMSAIDLLFNEGPKSLQIIRSGRLHYDVPLQKQEPKKGI